MLIELNNQEVANKGGTFQTITSIYAKDSSCKFDTPEHCHKSVELNLLPKIAKGLHEDGHILSNYLFYIN